MNIINFTGANFKHGTKHYDSNEHQSISSLDSSWFKFQTNLMSLFW